MLMQLKMYGRFVLWLLNKVTTAGGTIPRFFGYWKESVRDEFGMSILLFVIATLSSIVVSLVIGLIITNGEKPASDYALVPLCFNTFIYFCVIISALYDVFVEEYERTFTILKKD